MSNAVIATQNNSKSIILNKLLVIGRARCARAALEKVTKFTCLSKASCRFTPRLKLWRKCVFYNCEKSPILTCSLRFFVLDVHKKLDQIYSYLSQNVCFRGFGVSFWSLMLKKSQYLCESDTVY